MITSYIFDVDGTLTPARESMEKEFHDSFISWVESQSVVTSFIKMDSYTRVISGSYLKR